MLFDCYSPEPALVQLEQARLDVFHTHYTPMSEDDFDSGWEELPVHASASSAYQYRNLIDEAIGEKVLERIRNEMIREVSQKQAFSLVINLTDVIDYVSSSQLRHTIAGRGVKGLQYAFAVFPTAPPIRKDTRRGRIGRGSFINYGGGHVTPYEPEYLYSEYSAQALVVDLIL